MTDVVLFTVKLHQIREECSNVPPDKRVFIKMR